jgi:peptidoglycan hydrolase-like protein with peptidoglycan-binding domain
VNFTATPLSGSVDVTATDTLIDLDYQNSTLTGLSVNNIDREINFNNNDSSSMVIIPASGSIDTSITNWNTSGTYYKKWTETGDGSTGNTTHTIGDLKANTYYTVKVDTSIFNTYLSNASGEISFTYTGGYSSHNFEIEENNCRGHFGGSLPQDAHGPPAMPNPSDDNPKGGFNIIINNGLKQTDNQTVALKLFGGVDARKMIISENPDFKNSIKEPYQKTRQWSLSYGDGLKTVYVKFYTKYGVESEVVSDSIILDSGLKKIISTKPETIIENEPAEKTSLPKTSIKENIALNPIVITKKLKLGSNNNQVIQLQDKLKQLNLFSKEIKSNGNFGPTTIQAVKEFQKSVGIYPCGTVGPRTRKALNNQEFITNKDYRFVKDLKYNDKGEEIKQLQTRLRDQSFFPYYVKSTGWFGPITKTAVKLFQKFHGVIGNGIVGELVRGKLNF